MLNEPRTYRHSPILIGLAILFLGFSFFAAFLAFDSDAFAALLPFVFVMALVGAYLIYLMTSKTIISGTEISSQTLLGTKSLAWGEINRVSGRHYGIKLHNLDGDITVSPSPQLPRYEELIEFIGEKRPDLFSPLEYAEMTRGWTVTILTMIVIFLIVGMAALSVIETEQWFMSIFIVLIGALVAGLVLSSPQSIAIEGRSLRVKYLLKERILQADEITSVELKSQSSRNGRNYFIVLNLPQRKSLRITSMNPSLPIAYLVLKNWQQKNH